MTTFEHALLGINGLLATGLHRRHGWKLAAIAGIAAVAPDWDGLPMLIDMSRFEHGHRVWGHSLLACLILGVCLGLLDYRFDLIGRIASRLVKIRPLRELERFVDIRTGHTMSVCLVWILVAVLAAMSQILADAVVSGGKGLTDWALKPFWPWSDWQFVYPMIPWGNVGVTVIFSIAMIAQVKSPRHVQSIALAAIVSITVYIATWGSLVAQAK